MDEESERGFSGGKLRLAFGGDIGGVVSGQRPGPAKKAGVFAVRSAQRKFLSGCKVSPLGLIWDTVQHAEHGIILAENAANGGGGMDAKRLKFAQEKESEDVIDIGVGECDAGDGRVASRLAGMQFRRGFDLKAQVGRSAEQEQRERFVMI